MTSIALPGNSAILPLLDQTQKRAAVEALIEDWAYNHAGMDVGIGLIGFLPIPGIAFATLVGAIAVQAPLIYKPMARKIAEIYGRSPDSTTQREVSTTAWHGGGLDIAAAFGTDFFTEIAGDFVQEVGAGSVLTFVPVLGGFAGIALDMYIAWTMTWRVGIMVALYQENGEKWVGGSRKATYEIVKSAIKAGKQSDGKRPTISQMVGNTSAVQESQSESVRLLAHTLLEAGLTKADVRDRLIKRGLPAELVDAVVARL